MFGGQIRAIVPLYKNLRQWERCRAALAAQTRGVEVWVHDNSEVNIGFTGAVNQGLRAAREAGVEMAIVLNQDVYLAADAVEKLAAFFAGHPRCAIAGIRQRSSLHPEVVIHAGCRAAYPTGVHICGRDSDAVVRTSGKMPWVNGACMAVRMQALGEIGLMDERFFLFGSDSDWCYSARAKGWEVWYCAEAQGVHETGASTQVTPETMRYLRADMEKWGEKWVGTELYGRLNREFGISTLNVTAGVR